MKDKLPKYLTSEGTTYNRYDTPEDRLHHELINYAYMKAGKLDLHKGNDKTHPEYYSIEELLTSILNYTKGEIKWKQ